mgnify:CR=1 FL=1
MRWLWRGGVLGLVLVLVMVAATVDGQTTALAGVIDFHVHSGPDSRPRSVSDLEIARIAKRAGMRGLVFKNHFTMTADRAWLAMQEVDGIEIFGGVALNHAVGGLNAEAVRQLAAFSGGRGKVVWLPTFDAEFWMTRAGGGAGQTPSRSRSAYQLIAATSRGERSAGPPGKGTEGMPAIASNPAACPCTACAISQPAWVAVPTP